MATGTIFFKVKQSEFRDGISGKTKLKIDALTSFRHSRAGSVSKFPIEDGSTISDHVTQENLKLSITGLISNTPLQIWDSAITAATSAIPKNAIFIPVNAIASIAQLAVERKRSERLSREKKSFEALEEINNRRIPFTFVTRLKTYNNMVMVNLEFSKEPTTGGALPFTAELEQIKIVQGKKGDVGAFFDSLNGKTTQEFGIGKKQPSPLGTAAAGKVRNRSILKSIVLAVK